VKRLARVTLVTDPRYDEERIVSVVERAAPNVAGFAVQLRDRTNRTDEELLPFAMRLREITARHGALLVVNRRVELARRIGADGIHAPVSETETETESESAWRSAPAHSDRDVQNARIARVDAVLVSPIFSTPGKGHARGIAAIASARSIAPGLQIIALGGVDPANARSCFAAGASGVAVIRALLDAEDPAAAARALLAPRW